MNTDSPRPIRSENRFRKPCFDWRSARPKRSRRAENRGRLTSLNEAWVPHPHADLQACAAVFPSLSGLLQTVFCAALSPEAWPSSHERAERVNRLRGRDSNPDTVVQSRRSRRRVRPVRSAAVGDSRVRPRTRPLLQSLEREAAPIDLQDEKPSVAAIEELESSGQVRQERSAVLNQVVNCYWMPGASDDVPLRAGGSDDVSPN